MCRLQDPHRGGSEATAPRWTLTSLARTTSRNWWKRPTPELICGKPGHFIGHLQTNKVNKVVGRAAMIESVDSLRLMDKIEAAAQRLDLVQDILIEINIGAEASKSGVSPEALWELTGRCRGP